MASFLHELRRGIFEAFEDNGSVVMLGEDIVDPYGGAFKVTQGLSTKFPDRVMATPICEAGFTGLAAGMAIRGLRPIVEIMFGDFLTLSTDQLVNHITKFAMMYPGVRVPVVIRTPMGGGRGYGATHSQSLEKMFLGVPGLSVVAPSLAHNPGDLIKLAVQDDTPVLFIENKLLYGMEVCGSKSDTLAVTHRDTASGYPLAVVRNLSHTPSDVTVICYGGASRHILAVMRRYAGEEISIKAIFPSLLNGAVPDELINELGGTSHILVVEEGTAGFNWGSELTASLYERTLGRLKRPIRRLAAANTVIPCADALERQVLVTEEKIEQEIMEILS
jgi:pyruvate/2-oxoglutarate/acetoin dehydrogenase E1 component